MPDQEPSPPNEEEVQYGPPPDLSWMRTNTEWGVRVRPGKAGLKLGALNVGTYAEIPDRWPYDSALPRGAQHRGGVQGLGYSVFEKQEVWADSAAGLYEEAIQRRWASASAIPWPELKPLPDEVERAIGQICTGLSEQSQSAGEATSRWLHRMTYGYHEIKLYLATIVFDCARHSEAFRKRALANGGGLGIEDPGWTARQLLDAENYSEMSVLTHVLHASYLLTLYKWGHRLAPSPAERTLFALAMQDKARHLAYGMEHLRYLLLRRPDRRPEIHLFLDKGEAVLARDAADDALWPAFALLAAGGRERLNEVGPPTIARIRRQIVIEYLRRLDWAGLPERRDRLARAFRAQLD